MTAGGPRSSRRRRAVVALLGLSVAAAVAGTVLLPLLLRESPVLLLAVQSSYAQMGLASPRVDPVTFVTVAAARRWLGEVIAFAGGRVLGTDVLRWYRRRGGAPPPIPERLRRPRAPLRDLAVVVLPHPLLSAFFGMAGMPPLRFGVLKLVGSVLTVVLFWAAAEAAVAPLAHAADFLDANAVVLTVVAVAVAAAWTWWQRRVDARAEDS